MKRWKRFMFVTCAAITAFSSPALAGTWQQDQTGWYWLEDDGTYPVSSWRWLDWNQDGIEECYYFDEDGYLLTNTETPDGYLVGDSGGWIAEDGQIQQRVADEQVRDEEVRIALEQYSAAVQNMMQLNSVAIRAEARIKETHKSSEYAESEELYLSANFKAKDIESSDFQYIMDTHISMSGRFESMSFFYADGIAYIVDDDNNKYKSEALISAPEEMQSLYLLILPLAGGMSDVKVTDNGNKLLTFTITEKTYDSIINYFLFPTYSEELYLENQGTVMLSPDGYILSSTISMKTFESGEDGIDMYELTASIEFDNPGQPVDFVLPSTEGYESAEDAG